MKLTTRALIEFQRDAEFCRPSDWQGKSLLPDGNAGLHTRYALAIADLPYVKREIHRVAAAELGGGAHETSENDGPRIRVYQALTGAPRQPWCASFVSWVLHNAGYPALHTASAKACLEQFDELTEHPALLDLFGWRNRDGTGHVGFVWGFDADSTDVITLEGNSADRLRLCQRPRDGLEFRRLPCPPEFANVIDATIPIVVRSTDGTR